MSRRPPRLISRRRAVFLLLAALLCGCVANQEPTALETRATDRSGTATAAPLPDVRLSSASGQPFQVVQPGMPAEFVLKVENLGDDPASIQLRVKNNRGWAVALDELQPTDLLRVDAGATLSITLTVQHRLDEAEIDTSSLTIVQLLSDGGQVMSELQVAVTLEAAPKHETITLDQVIADIEQTMLLTMRPANESPKLYADAARDAKVLGTIAPDEQLLIRSLPLKSGSDNNTWIAVQRQDAQAPLAEGWLVASQTNYDDLNLPERYPPPIDRLAVATPIVLFQAPTGTALELILSRPTLAQVLSIRPAGTPPRLYVAVQVGAEQRIGWVDLCRTTYAEELMSLWAQRAKRSLFNLPALKECSA